MNAYQIIHINYAIDKKTLKPKFGKGFLVEQQGFDIRYSHPIRFFKNLKDVKKFFKGQMKGILGWNKEMTLRTKDLTDTCLKIEFEPKGNGYPCEMYLAIPIDLPDDFINGSTFEEH